MAVEVAAPLGRAMSLPNAPRPENPARQVRVEDDLWRAAMKRAAEQGTTVSAVIRECLRRFVR